MAFKQTKKEERKNKKMKSKEVTRDSQTKKIFLVFFFSLFSFFFCIPLFAQGEAVGLADEASRGELNYYLDLSGEEPRFIQRLSWESDLYVSRYIVIIEQITQRRDRNVIYLETERRETKDNFIEVSLVAGLYRYRLEVYDLLDELAYTTNWQEFEIIRAVQPNVTGFSPGAFYLDEDEEWVITVRGRNILPETQFLLIGNNTRIRPIRVTVDGNNARLEFSAISLTLGSFHVYARNPGGLDNTLDSEFLITNKKPFDFNITLSYAPVIPVYGYLFNDFTYEGRPQHAPFSDTFYPLSAGISLSFLPVKRVWWNIGAQVSGSFSMLSDELEYHSTNAYLVNAHASLFYQIHFFKRRLFINMHIGAGIFSLMDFNYNFGNFYSESRTQFNFSAIGGLSFTYMFNKPYFATIGADFIHAFTPEQDSPMPGIIRSFIGIGIQL